MSAAERHEDLPVFVAWVEFVKWLLPTTEKFPKRVRFALSSPIGNLTSQHFANFYLGHLDHYTKDQLGIRHYLRYMDDREGQVRGPDRRRRCCPPLEREG